MQLHYAFWNLFRSICLRGKPKCRGDLFGLVESDYQSLVKDEKCPFVEFCNSADSDAAIDEYEFPTDWY